MAFMDRSVWQTDDEDFLQPEGGIHLNFDEDPLLADFGTGIYAGKHVFSVEDVVGFIKWVGGIHPS